MLSGIAAAERPKGVTSPAYSAGIAAFVPPTGTWELYLRSEIGLEAVEMNLVGGADGSILGKDDRHWLVAGNALPIIRTETHRSGRRP